MLETALILAFERKRRGIPGSLFEPWLSRKVGVPLPIQHWGSCPNAHVQIVFMTVLRRSDRAF